MRRNKFLSELEHRFLSMQQYEDKRLQEKARAALPLLLFEERAQERLRSLQEAIRNGQMEDPNVSVQEMLLLELLDWFKGHFEWVNSPDCDHCGEETAFSHLSSDPKHLAHANRVEVGTVRFVSNGRSNNRKRFFRCTGARSARSSPRSIATRI